MIQNHDCETGGPGQAKTGLPTKEELQDLADFFKHFSEFSRMKILAALHAREMCVCELVDMVGMNQPAVSHQLRILKHGKIVKARKQGKHVYYCLDDDHVYKLIRDGLDHIRGNCLP